MSALRAGARRSRLLRYALLAGVMLSLCAAAAAPAQAARTDVVKARARVAQLKKVARRACLAARHRHSAKARRACRSSRRRLGRAQQRLRLAQAASASPRPRTAPGKPAAAPKPSPTASATPGAFEPGLVSGSDVVNEARYDKALAPKVMRVEFDITQPASDLRDAIAANAANGTRVLLLAGFSGTMPTAAQARNLATWAATYGPGGSFWAGRSDGYLAVREIELGNETSYGYQYGDNWDKPSYVARAKEYALRFRDAQEAVHGANPQVGLLAQADDANTGSANWVNGMFDAVPDLASRVAGWTIHPYGPQAKWQPRIDRLIAQTAARGAPSSIPIYVTEWGLATDDGRCLSDNYGWNPCMSYASAADALQSTVSAMRARYGSRLRAFFLYQGHDQRASGADTDREHYFGALRSDLSDKGGYTSAVRSLLASR